MTQKVPCRICQALILPVTAASNGGLCWPCKRDTRQQQELAKTQRLREREEHTEYLLRRDLLIRKLGQLSDAQLIAKLQALPPLADEDDPIWMENDYWHNTAEVYVALSEACAERRLRPSILLLLDRACYGDPGEIMRRLRHSLEAIVVPDWTYLADICLGCAHSPRKGTRLWAIEQLTVLDDPRARSVFERAVKTEPSLISEVAAIGLLRLKGGNPN
jgi:hypothetical protein